MPADVPGSAAPRKRPLGVTLLSLVMGWLTLAAVLNAFVFPYAIEGWPLYITVLTTAYAVTAGATTFGLWRMRSWTLTVFRAWGMVLLLLMAGFVWDSAFLELLTVRPAESLPMFLATTGVVALVYWLLHRYIRRRVAVAM